MKKFLTALVTAVILTACFSTTNVKPLAPGAKACSSPADCPSGYVCRFPGVDTRPQCMPY